MPKPVFTAIPPLDEAVRAQALRRLDQLTKPTGSLGVLEPIAAHLCAVQRTLSPQITKPLGLVFAADHGVAARGVSAYPPQVTLQMVANFLGGGAGIGVLARLFGIDLWVIDAGVNGRCSAHARLIDAKVGPGTRDFVVEPAMTPSECFLALERGRDTLNRLAESAGTVVILGEMGIGNTSSAAMLMHGLTGFPLEDCVGRGTGLDDAALERKRATLKQAATRCRPPRQPLDLLTEFGGFEIAMLTGAALAAAARGKLVLVDGFTVTVAVAVAARIDSRVLDYCVFGHRSAEHAHEALLQSLGVRPLLDLDLRLGEGTGAALALPLLRAAIALFTQMATFESAGVSNRDEPGEPT